ncbi:MAG TPA: M14 family zinc carboxypeptidase [Pilimelia sp.]|nr:M14 family zinc carboxypeptidase [Pilimelia sp.]
MSRFRSATRVLAGVLVAATAMAAGPPAAYAEPGPGPRPTREFGNGPERNDVAAMYPATALALGATGEGQPDARLDAGADRGYPRQNRLPVFPEDPTDKSIKLGLTPYHAIAPRLNDLQARSNRVSAEVIGRTALGRDLYLVTLTAPERPAETRQQHAWRALIEDAPVRAARDRALLARYKSPVWINGNIHGNEWEGTDGALRLIEEIATATDAATARLMRRTRIYLTVTNNPDGRVAGTRANGNGFDLNRDYATSSQSESRAMRDVGIGTQPLVMLDEHGYTGTTLIEPATAPHGQNYEYDLYIKHAYPNALGMEKAIGELGHPETARADIPFRDFAPGDWDDWPPIFTPMYAMYHGAIGHTVEVPLRVNGAAYDTLPVEELRRRSAINVNVVEATIRAAIAYTDENRTELIGDQIELFRRGWAGEPQRFIPDGYVPGFGPEDRYSTVFPRAYVIPAGAGQRSAVAAARLVDHLVAHDVRVRRATAPFTLAGRRYAAGSYLVDLHQPKRGLANAMLEAGRDISANVPQMYDISGWSHRLLWGASVDIVRAGRLPHATVAVRRAAPTGGVSAGPGADLLLTLTDSRDVRAVDALLDQGVRVRWRDDGTVVVPASARRAAAALAHRLGVRFTAAHGGGRGTLLRSPVVAAAAAPDELFALRQMGFDVRPVSTAVLNGGFDLSGVDVLFVSSGLSYTGLNPAARAAVDAFLARGGVVTRGATGAAFNADAGLLPVTAVPGRADANGVVSVIGGNGPVASRGLPHSFVFSPLWFTGVGAGVVVEQRYAAGNPLVAGHWKSEDDGSGGPDQAAGQAAVVSGVAAKGTATVLFGTEPLFRDHPKGLYAQVARAIFWSTTR